MQSLLGLGVFIFVGYLLSSNRKKILWRLVAVCLVIQFGFALAVLRLPVVAHVFEAASSFFVHVLDYSSQGAQFLFGNLMDAKTYGFIFAFNVLPTIVFFSALTSLLYHLGVLQLIVNGFAWVFTKTLRVSGAESLSMAGNIFLGQTEAPLLIKPYLARMTRSEVFCVMVGGMANIAGGVLAAYVGFLGGDDPVQRQLFATHLLCASIISAPAAILISKLMEPEPHLEKIDQSLVPLVRDKEQHLLEAISSGTTDGVSMAINVAAMLLVFTALVAMVNAILGSIGSVTGFNAWLSLATNHAVDKLSLQYILGFLFSPVAWLTGVDSRDLQSVARLLGEKTILNEFYAYADLSKMRAAGAFVSERSVIIVTYALCGFANIASIGIQLGGIGIMAPNHKPLLARLGVRALIGGTLATLMTACVVALLV